MKKLISIILCLILVLPNVSVMAENSDIAASSDAQVGYSYELLNALGVNVSIADSQSVKKGEFLYLVMQLINLSEGSGEVSSFADVRVDSEYYASVENALKMGIISKAENFYPNNQIKFSEACKIMVSALGFDYLAASKGGYPTGYMVAADQLGLISSVPYGKDLNLESTLIMLYNFLYADVNTIAGLKDDDGLTNIYESVKNVLYIYHDVKEVRGIVDSDENTGLYEGDYRQEKGYISINEITYKKPYITKSFIGKNVVAYVKETGNTDTIIYMYEYDNRIVELAFEDADILNTNYITYYEGNKEKKLNLISGPAVIYNSKAVINQSYKSLATKGTRLEITDNNMDGKYDVISIKKYDTYHVDSTDSVKKTISDKKNQVLILKGDELRLTVKKDSEFIDFEDIAVNDLLSVYTSLDGTVVEIVVSTYPSVSGKITETNFSDNVIYINDVPYAYGAYFEKYFLNESIVNKSGKFLLADDGVIQVLTDGEVEDIQYVYLIATAHGKGLDDSIKAKVLTQKGEVKVMTFAEKINFNGTVTDSKNLGSSIFGDDGNGKEQLVRMSFTVDNIIKMIDTNENKFGVLSGNENVYDNLTQYKFPDWSNIIYIPATSMFVPHFRVSSSAPVFLIATDESIPEERRYRVSDKSYLATEQTKVVYPDTPANASNGYPIAYFYDVTVNGDVNAMVIYNKSGTQATAGFEAKHGLVYSVRRAIDMEGDQGLAVVVFSAGVFTRYFINDESVLNPNSEGYTFDNPGIQKGDYIRFGANMDNKMNSMTRVFSIDSKSVVSTGINRYSGEYYYGPVYSKGDGLINMMPENAPYNYTDITNYSSRFSFLIPSDVAVYDSETGDIYEGSVDEILPYVSSPGNCSKVLIKTATNGSVTQVVIYK
ncbi:MAG: hypothetical protein IKV88_07025 [Clostridia bacterium]|nr:hypothetical protein [Clostridia bacterium]